MQGAGFGFLPVIIPPAKTFGIKAVPGGAAIVMCGVMTAAGLKLIARMRAAVAVLVSSGLAPAALPALPLNRILPGRRGA